MQNPGKEWVAPWERDCLSRLLQRLGLLVLGVLAALILEASPARGAGEGEEPGAPILRLSDATGSEVDALLLETRLDVEITGLLARGTLIQRFRNDSAHWMEAEYLVPLPADAAVTRLDMQIGERRIRGEIREREEARVVYDAARRAGKRAALLEQQRPHLFTSRVANLPPGEDISVRLELLLPVRLLDGEFSLRFPTTITRPYIPGNSLPASGLPSRIEAEGQSSLTAIPWVRPTDQVPDAPLILAPQRPGSGSDANPRHPLSLAVSLDPGVPLASVDALYHDVDVHRRGEVFDVSLRGGRAEMDRDLVLRWRARPSTLPQAALFRERLDGKEYALLMMLPPRAAATQAAPLARELILVLDISGSMQGEPIRQARNSALHALESLVPGDYVNIVAFNDRVYPLFERARPVNASTREAALSFVRGLDADRGTEMLPALARALHMGAPPRGDGAPPPLRQIVFVTDGAIGNEEALFDLLASEGEGARLFTVGIGSAPNHHFMQRAAELGRGEAIYIAQAQEVAPQMNALFDRVSQPLARDLAVHWPVPVEAFPTPLPDLYVGHPLLQVVRLESTDIETGARIRVTGQLAGRAWEQQLALPQRHDAVGVATYWARRKLTHVLQGRQRGESAEAIRAAALPLALRFGLASPFTSFVAVEEEPVRPRGAPLTPQQLANLRPRGQAIGQVAFAQGATTGLAKLYLGLLLAFVALFAWTMQRGESDRP